jgi:hypothetical protein
VFDAAGRAVMSAAGADGVFDVSFPDFERRLGGRGL